MSIDAQSSKMQKKRLLTLHASQRIAVFHVLYVIPLHQELTAELLSIVCSFAKNGSMIW